MLCVSLLFKVTLLYQLCPMSAVLTFFPGPTKISDHIPGLYAKAFEEGIASISHRSKKFEEVYAFTMAQLRDKLAIPVDYQIFIIGSATEAWEIIPQSLIQSAALHLHSGAFGAKWADYAQRIHPNIDAIPFGVNDDPAQLLLHLKDWHEALCLTHNETSNGTLLETSMLAAARKRLGDDRLLCMDATSSLAGISLPWHLADVWYASTQKCLGQPAGLAVFICGPRAIEKAQVVNDTAHYNSLLTLAKFAQANQTSFTPNVLAIYVLGQYLDLIPPVVASEPELRARAERYYRFIESHPLISPLVTRVESQSPTVVPVACEPVVQQRMKEAALAEGMLLGAGYAPWKESTFRIANFPAYTDEDQNRLLAVLEQIT